MRYINRPDVQPYTPKETRTILITNLQNEADCKQLKQRIDELGEVREVYGIKNEKSIIFFMFYDARHAKTVKEKLDNTVIGQSKIRTYYTISKYEIPREDDMCDFSKNQGTLLLISRDLDVPLTESEILSLFAKYGDIKELREYKTFQKFIEFNDSRCAMKAFNDFGERRYKNGMLFVKCLWDTNKKMRWDIIKETDNILQSIAEPNAVNDFVPKRQAITPTSTPARNKNIFYKAMDDFIVDNIDEIASALVEHKKNKGND